MTNRDIDNLRPSYLNRVHQMGFYWSVWNVDTGLQVMMFVRHKGTKNLSFIAEFDENKHEVYWWERYDHCTYALSQMGKEPWTVHGDAVKAGIPAGNYKCTICRAGGQKLVSYEFTI